MSSIANKNILITCGPTWVPIDAVRVISNISTGELGQTLARECQQRGANVTVFEGPVENRLQEHQITVRPFKYYEELMALIRLELVEDKKHYDAIFHAAAVSDYMISNPLREKIKSDQTDIHLDLIPLPKLIRSLRKISPDSLLVGFKLEPDMNEDLAGPAAKGLFDAAYCDLVVANTLKEKNYLGYVVSKDQILASDNTRQGITQKLLDIVGERL
ncbi:MAG: hypothetical protein K8I00_06945 [Candidatus Omnitrophica bacterium]|nr:hypothetical protein [Candidatus Omnitrophota bacterium]